MVTIESTELQEQLSALCHAVAVLDMANWKRDHEYQDGIRDDDVDAAAKAVLDIACTLAAAIAD